jgi:enterochelin esterase-like enzyme
MHTRRILLCLLVAAGLAAGAVSLDSASPKPVRIEVSFPASLASQPLDGRVILVLSRRDTPPPIDARMTGPDAQPMFGIDVNGLKPGQPAIVDAGTRGWPVESLSSIPPGDYYAQAVLNVYTTVHRADGHTIKVHLDQGEGQDYRRTPGNLTSEVTKVHIDPVKGSVAKVVLSKKIPPIVPPVDTKYVKHIRFKSDILSRWWGTDIYLGAIVLLPEGWSEHPAAKYPVLYDHGHFPRTFNGLRESPPDPKATGRERTQQESGYRFYQNWVAGKMGRVLIVLMQHPTAFYDDSYAVNSANNGPYGDALWQELVPRVETQFRGIGQPWARMTYGGSTGGWESLAWQVFYPDQLNGVWSFCPDPVDFRAFQAINIYEDDNAFYMNSEWKKTPARPWSRALDDQTTNSQFDANRYEEVLGTKGRSGEQMDIFMDVFGPVGADGYPKLLYDKWTGVIDKSVAPYWRENYDLRHIVERDWKTLGPKLVGKIHVFAGDQDTFILEEAAFKLQEFLEGTKDPYYAGSFTIGKRKPHCYAGDDEYPGQRAEERIIPKMIERMLMTAPAGADLSWRY